MTINFLVPVFDGNVEGAIAHLKKQAQRSGFFKEIARHTSYMKPGEARRRKQKVARAKVLKAEKRKLAKEPNDELHGGSWAAQHNINRQRRAS